MRTKINDLILFMIKPKKQLYRINKKKKFAFYANDSLSKLFKKFAKLVNMFVKEGFGNDTRTKN